MLIQSKNAISPPFLVNNYFKNFLEDHTVSILKLCLASASEQFVSSLEESFRSERSRHVLCAAMLTITAVGAIGTSPAQAQSWAGQSAATADGALLPQDSAGRWGDMLGGTLGRVLAGSVGTSSNSVIARQVQIVASGVAQEVGSNLGRRAAVSQYKNADSVPQSQQGQKTVVKYSQDNLDVLALRALVANDDLARAVASLDNTSTLNDRYTKALGALEVGMRNAITQGYDVMPWMAARAALQKPVVSVAHAELSNLGKPMIERLCRPGGPGMAAVSAALKPNDDRSLAQLSAQYQRPTISIRSIPIEDFGR